MGATSILALCFCLAFQDEATVPLPPGIQDEPLSVTTQPVALQEPAVSDPILPMPSKVLPQRTGSSVELPPMERFVFWTVGVLLLLGGFLYGVRRFLRRSRFQGAGVIRLVASKPLSAKQQVFLVEVGSKLFLVGSTKEHLTTLGEISEPGDVAALRSRSPLYLSESVDAAFQRNLRSELKDSERALPAEESFKTLVGELREMKKTVQGWSP